VCVAQEQRGRAVKQRCEPNQASLPYAINTRNDRNFPAVQLVMLIGEDCYDVASDLRRAAFL